MSAISQTATAQFCFLWWNFRGHWWGKPMGPSPCSGLSFLLRISPRWCSRPCTWNVTNRLVQTLLERQQHGNFEAADHAPNQKRQNGDFGVQKIMNFAQDVRYWISQGSAIPNWYQFIEHNMVIVHLYDFTHKTLCTLLKGGVPSGPFLTKQKNYNVFIHHV